MNRLQKRITTLLNFGLVSAALLSTFQYSAKATEMSRHPSGGLIVANDVGTSTPIQIYLMRPDGTGKHYLTAASPNSCFLPAWSYDGRYITYGVYEPGKPTEIWAMDADGSNKHRLTSASALLSSYSPDGKQILYVSQVPFGHPEVWLMNTDGTKQHRLTTTLISSITRTGQKIIWSTHPTFSPDGSKIVYASTQSGQSQIWTMNRDGSGLKRLTFPSDTAPDANAPNWSPDGQSIVFWSGYETLYGNIWIMNKDGSGRKQLTFDPGPISNDNPAWSADGQSIIFESTRVPGHITTWIMNRDGSNLRLFLQSSYGDGLRPWKN
jgi:Tol biopolymer transport system component